MITRTRAGEIIRASAGLRHAPRATSAMIHANRKGGPGRAFAAFGRRLGLQIAFAEPWVALDMLLTPVSIVRYWEFPFVMRHLPTPPGDCLDVASPRLFSYFVASRLGPAAIRVLNPDVRDAQLTSDLARRLGIGRVTVDAVPVSAVAGQVHAYDSIWSISVLEHIPGDGDRDAMPILWEALRPGGRLLITVPVDRQPWDEYRDSDVYELDVPADERGFFFQRWYDKAAIEERLLGSIHTAGVRMEWFGEREPGHFAAYEDEWRARGHARTVDDPREIVDHYADYPDWDAMPGRGVAGLAIDKAQS